jgi:polyhydroxyalkanoate synthesis regulator protein
MIRLVKYTNKKMYNAQTSKYMNLAEIKDAIKGGERVQISDYETGEDITPQILSQILVQTKKVNPEILRQLIEKGE